MAPAVLAALVQLALALRLVLAVLAQLVLVLRLALVDLAQLALALRLVLADLAAPTEHRLCLMPRHYSRPRQRGRSSLIHS